MLIKIIENLNKFLGNLEKRVWIFLVFFSSRVRKKIDFRGKGSCGASLSLGVDGGGIGKGAHKKKR